MPVADLQHLLKNPSPENWQAIVEMGTYVRRKKTQDWSIFCEIVTPEALKHWPPELERLCPAGWPEGFKQSVEHRVIETDTYGHYIQGICSHPDLKLADGSQAVWLERRFTGGVVHVSTVQKALRLIGLALSSLSWEHLKQARHILMTGVRQVGKIGGADLPGGVVVEDRDGNPECACGKLTKPGRCANCGYLVNEPTRHEYRLEVEVKVGNQPQSPEQIARMNSVRRRGGCYVVTRSVAEAVEQIKAFIASVG